MPKLTVRLPGLPPVTHALSGGVITVGRTPDNLVQVADASVSKHHAKLEVVNGDYHVIDLDSRNGTFVNNQRIRDALVHHSDLIRFAGVEAVFETDALEDDAAVIAATAVTRPLSAAMVAASKAPTPRGPLPTAASASAAPARTLPAGAAPMPSTPATAKPVAAGFSPKAPAPSGRGMPTWAVLLIGIALAAGAAGGVWWWLNNSSGADSVEVAVAPETVVTAPPTTPPPEARPEPPDNTPTEPAENTLASRPISAVDVPAIGVMLRDVNPEVRRQAARALHALGKDSAAALKEIRDAVKDSDPETRLWASLSLAQLDPADQASVPVLMDGLKNENPVVRQVSALSLSVIRFHGDEATPVIETLIKTSVEDQDEDVRKAASSASKLLSAAASLRGN